MARFPDTSMPLCLFCNKQKVAVSVPCTLCALITSSWWMAYAHICKVTLENDGGDVPTNLVNEMQPSFSATQCGALKRSKITKNEMTLRNMQFK